MRSIFGLFLFGIASLTLSLQAQSLDEARKLYLEGKYAESKPAFEKAIKSSPKNPSYNQWYGTCLLETGELDKAEFYLEFAASKNVQGAYKSLGKLYFIQYRFGESVEAYEEYIELIDPKKQPNEEELVSPMYTKAKNADRMLRYCEDVQIIDSIVVSKNDFLTHYNLSEESGALYYEASEPRVIYENQLKDKRYFAKQNEMGKYQIYMQSKLLENWSDVTALALPRDSVDNDDFPYVLADGVTIYYASTGSGSIGGYDLFVTRYNMNNDTYFTPEQLGMPFNSPYNDYMMAIDEYNNIGYFATDRFQPEDKVVIYTFIPNTDKRLLENAEEDVLKSRAEIRSIRDSWREDVDYASLIQRIYESNNEVKSQEKRDFDFVINDDIVYHNLEDFKSDAAKDLYIQSEAVRIEMENLEQQLDQKRLDYANMSDAKQQSVSGGILTEEKKLEELSENHHGMIVKARNAEIKFLGE